jgi:fructose transport system substrate-binding protein
VGLVTEAPGPFFNKIQFSAQAAATAQGFELVVLICPSPGTASTCGGAPGRLGDGIDRAVAAGVKTVLIYGGDIAAALPALKRARTAGVQLIALDRTKTP